MSNSEENFLKKLNTEVDQINPPLLTHHQNPQMSTDQAPNQLTENANLNNNNNGQSPVASSVPVQRVIPIHVDNSLSEGDDASRSQSLNPPSRISPLSPYFNRHSPLSSYQSDRETVLSNPSSTGTLQETHILHNEGLQNVYFTEEHWSSTIKSFVTNSPPKFKQVIKAYRVQSTDKLTLVVEVISQPPAQFEWFCNDIPAEDSQFTISNGTNVSILTVEGPQPGVYSCSAKNPAGISKSYGYITIDDSKSYKQQSIDKDFEIETESKSATKRLTKRPPKFLNQVPHFVLQPTDEALIDVEVDSDTSVRFTWYVDGKLIHSNNENVVFYSPKPTRSVAQFLQPISGQYTVVAQNEYGAAKSSGYVEIQKDSATPTHLHLLRQRSDVEVPSLLPTGAARGIGKRASSITHTTVHTTTYVHRSSSVPSSPDHESITLLEPPQFQRKTATPEPTEQQQKTFLNQQQQPQVPIFLSELPEEIILKINEKLILKAECEAQPPAKFVWNCNGADIEQIENFKLYNKLNGSTLLVLPPIPEGRYQVVAINDYGQAEIHSNVRSSLNEALVTEDVPILNLTENITKIVKTRVENEETVEVNSDSEDEKNQSEPHVFIKTYTDELKPNKEETGEEIEKVSKEISFQSMIPIIVAAPERQIFVPNGLPLVLELCVVSKSPTTIRWYRRNFELRPSPQISIVSEKENHSKVVYQDPQEGVYKAIVTNEFGIANYEVRVLVEFPRGRRNSGINVDQEAPAFLRRSSLSSSDNSKTAFNIEKRASIPKNENLPKPPKFVPPFLTAVKHVNMGEKLILECKTDAIPEAQFYWRQNNFEVKNNKQVRIEKVDVNHSKATFEKPVNGRYEVTAQNSMGKDVAYTKVIVNYNVVENKGEAQKETVIMEKETPEANIVEKAPEANVEISKSDLESTKAFESNKLIEPDLENIKVSKANKISKIPVPVLEAKKVEIPLKEESKKTDEEIKSEVKDVEVIENKTIVLIEDLHKVEQIEPIKEVSDLVEQQLNIKDIKLKDQEISLSKQISEQIAEELVSEKEIEEVIKKSIDQKPPRFLKTLEELLSENEITEGTQLYVEVNVDKVNTPNCMFQWFLNNRLIPPKYIEYHDHSSILNVPEIKKDMEGLLIVSVTNFYGADQSSINLSVKSGFSETIEKEDFTENTNIQKDEESYSLLVKVVESLAQTLVAKIFIIAFEEAAEKLRKSPIILSSEEDEDEANTISKTTLSKQQENLQFINNEDIFSVSKSQPLTINAKYIGEKCFSVQWYCNGEKIKPISDEKDIEHADGYVKLVLYKVGKNSEGVYECRAENKYNCALYKCTVKVIEESIDDTNDPTERKKFEASVETQIFINKTEDVANQTVILEIANSSQAKEKIRLKGKTEKPPEEIVKPNELQKAEELIEEFTLDKIQEKVIRDNIVKGIEQLDTKTQKENEEQRKMDEMTQEKTKEYIVVPSKPLMRPEVKEEEKLLEIEVVEMEISKESEKKHKKDKEFSNDVQKIGEAPTEAEHQDESKKPKNIVEIEEFEKSFKDVQKIGEAPTEAEHREEIKKPEKIVEAKKLNKDILESKKKKLDSKNLSKDESFEDIKMPSSDDEKIEEFEKLDFLDAAAQALQEFGKNEEFLDIKSNILTTNASQQQQLQKEESISSADELAAYVVEEKDLMDSEAESTLERHKFLKNRTTIAAVEAEEGYEIVPKMEKSEKKIEELESELTNEEKSKKLTSSITKVEEIDKKKLNDKIKDSPTILMITEEDASLNMEVETSQSSPKIKDDLIIVEASVELHFQSNEVIDFEFQLEIVLIQIYILESTIKENNQVYQQKLINVKEELDKESSTLEDLDTIRNIFVINQNYQWIIKRVVRSSVHQNYVYSLVRKTISNEQSEELVEILQKINSKNVQLLQRVLMGKIEEAISYPSYNDEEKSQNTENESEMDFVDLMEYKENFDNFSATTSDSEAERNQPPLFRENLKDAIFLVGESAQLKCVVSGWPIPKILWHVDGDNIVENNNYEIVYEDGISLLCFRKVIVEDEGEYSCDAINPNGKATTKCFVKVFVEESMQRLADNFIFRKIKRLHKTASGRTIESESETEQHHYSSSSKKNLKKISKLPKKFENIEECITESFVLKKNFDSEILTQLISLRTSRESAEMFKSILWRKNSLTNNKRLSSLYETPTNSIIEVNEEIKSVLKNNNNNNSQNLDDDEESFKSLNKDSMVDEQQSASKSLRQPRSLHLPNKLTYKGQPINVEISGPVHFLTANLFETKNSKTIDKIKSSTTTDKSLETPLEKYVETLCDFSQIVSKLTEKLNAQNNLLIENSSSKDEENFLKKIHSSPLKYSYQISSTARNCIKYERPSSRPYLVKTKSYCNQARVTDITQEWHLVFEPEMADVNILFSTYLLLNSSPNPLLKDVIQRIETTQLNSGSYLTMPRISNNKNNKKPTPLHTTQSIGCSKTPSTITKSFVIDPHKYDELKETIRQVEEDLNLAKVYKDSRTNELKQIENAIWAISERIAKNEPVSKVQAQLNEELLRTKLAEMILNLGPEKENETYDYGIVLKQPITILKDKLQFLESFIEEEDSIKEELQNIQKLPDEQRKPNSNIQRKAEALKRRRDEIARMTPLIAVVKNKLVNLEEVVEVDETQKNGRSTPYMERRTIHNLLISINQEINVIHDLCRKNNQVEGLNAVVEVLSRMCIHLDTIIDTLRLYKISTEEASSTIQASKQKTNQSVIITKKINEISLTKITPVFKENNLEKMIVEVNSNVDMQKDEEDELVNTFILNSGVFKTKVEPRSKLSLHGRKCRNSKKSMDSPELIQKHLKKDGLTPTETAIPTKNEAKTDIIEEKHLDKASTTEYRSNRNEFKTDCRGYLTPVYDLKNKEKAQIYQSNLGEIGQKITVKVVKREANQSITVILPMTVLNMQISQYIYDTDENCSMQMICEDSDGTISSVDDKISKQNKAEDKNNIDEIYLEYDELYKMISMKNSPIPFSNIGYQPLSKNIIIQNKEADKRNKSTTTPKSSLDSGKLNKTVIMKQNNNINLNQSNLLSPSVNFDEDLYDVSSMSENVPILFRKMSNVSRLSIRETAILSDEDDSSIVQIYNLVSSCTETFDLRRRRKHALLNAIVFPEIRAQITAKFLGDSFQIDVERMSETGRDSVVMVSEEYYNKRVKILRKNIADNNQLMILNESSEKNENDDDDDDDKSVFVDTLAKLNVSILARSLKDSVYVNLEEIPWDEIVANIEVPEEENLMNRSGTTIKSEKSETTTVRDNGSIVFNIIVAENHDEARSVASRRSYEGGSSQKGSLAGSQKTLHSQISFENIDIPTYIIKQGATASITCELNNYVEPESKIEWYRGKEHIQIISNKYDRVSHDLLELLIILHVNKDDGNLYSIRVNDQMYPVAYLIIEEAPIKQANSNNNEDDPQSQLDSAALRANRFLSFPQTMFVMQGQTAILSCQMTFSNLDVNWYHEQDLLEAGQDDRIYFEKSPNGWYKIVIEDVDFVDQGTYYACFEEMSTSITLVVEEIIDEREVQVSSAETNDDELSDYLVPTGSTATIACELDKNTSTDVSNLQWLRNNRVLNTSADNDGKFEHVINQHKHYLIIHNTHPKDSGVYSVRVNNIKFKVAQITIGTYQQQSLSGSRIKKISNSSLWNDVV